MTAVIANASFSAGSRLGEGSPRDEGSAILELFTCFNIDMFAHQEWYTEWNSSG